MEDLKKKAPEKKAIKLVLKPQHAESTLEYNGVHYRLADATEKDLETLFNASDIDWKYLFENN